MHVATTVNCRARIALAATWVPQERASSALSSVAHGRGRGSRDKPAHAASSQCRPPVYPQPLVEPAATSVPTAAVASRMASDELGAAPVRGHHLGTVCRTHSLSLSIDPGRCCGAEISQHETQCCGASLKTWQHETQCRGAVRPSGNTKHSRSGLINKQQSAYNKILWRVAFFTLQRRVASALQPSELWLDCAAIDVVATARQRRQRSGRSQRRR